MAGTNSGSPTTLAPVPNWGRSASVYDPGPSPLLVTVTVYTALYVLPLTLVATSVVACLVTEMSGSGMSMQAESSSEPPSNVTVAVLKAPWPAVGSAPHSRSLAGIAGSTVNVTVTV